MRPNLSSLAILLVLVAALASVGGCAKAPRPDFEPARVIAHTEAQCAFGPRVPNSAARDSATAYIARTLERLGAEVSVQPVRIPDPYSDGTLRLLNVVARFEPGRERRVMMASHYDSRPWADQEADTTLHGQPISGAIDGALSEVDGAGEARDQHADPKEAPGERREHRRVEAEHVPGDRDLLHGRPARGPRHREEGRRPRGPGRHQNRF